MKTYYWGIMDNKQKMPQLLFDRGTDAKKTCFKYNQAVNATKEKPRFFVKRFLLELKGKYILDVYEHERKLIKK